VERPGRQSADFQKIGLTAFDRNPFDLHSSNPRFTRAKKLRESKPIQAKPKAAKSVARHAGNAADWRSETLNTMRGLIFAALPEAVEEIKWRKPSNGMAGVPVWSHHGILCTGETYKEVVKLTFAKGASIPDPSHLFNSSLEGNTRRAIDTREGQKVDSRAFKALIKAAAALNAPPSTSKPAMSAKPTTVQKQTAANEKKLAAGKSKPVKLLSGGNPQVAKADGNAPVQAYIAAMPGWKRDIGQQLDALIERHVPKVRRAVKWNSPFYGIEGQGWFLSFHVFTRYVKVTFFYGASLRPTPPGKTPKTKDARWIDIHEHDKIDESQLAKWIKQAAAIPGWLA